MGSNNKNDNLQIDALKKELYILGTVRDQLAKELEAMKKYTEGWPA